MEASFFEFGIIWFVQERQIFAEDLSHPSKPSHKKRGSAQPTELQIVKLYA